MADDIRSSVKTRRPRKFPLVVMNPNPDDGDESSDDNDRTSNTYIPPTSSVYGYPGQPVTSPSTLSPPLEQQPLPSGSRKPPHPLTTNLQPSYSHSRSNPALSSPSTASSPAVESTPPPSTPGHSVGTVDLMPDGGQSVEPQIRSSSSSIDVAGSHSRNFIDKIMQVPHMVSRPHRRGTTRRPRTSPTVPSTGDPIVSPSSAVLDRVIILVTTNSENYSLVDISGGRDPAFIRERIYTQLRIPDEEQRDYSIYQTDVGAYAIGDALSDGEIFDICRSRGDSRGSVKFFVSLSSARVHDPSTHASSPVTGSYPPPVLLPSQGPPFSPKRGKSGGRPHFDSASSTSEPARADVNAGYEPSVSDDMDDQDSSSQRHTIRPVRSDSSKAQTMIGDPPSPSSSSRTPQGTYIPGSTPSPISQTTRPLSPADPRSNLRTQAIDPLRVDKYGGSSSSGPLNAWSPDSSRYNLQQDTYQALHYRTASDAAAERERNLRESESRLDHAGKFWKPQKDRYGSRHENDSGVDRMDKKPDSWVLVPNDIPSTNQGQRGGRSSSTQEVSRSPPISRPTFDGHRGERKLRSEKSTPRLAIPSHPRNPPPTPPGMNDGQRVSSRNGRTLPASWNATYQPTSNKTENSWSPRLAPVKSMNDLKAQIPYSLMPARRGNLPVSGSPNEQRSIKPQSSSITLRGAYEHSRSTLSPSGIVRPLPPLAPPHASSSDLNQGTRGPSPFSGGYASRLSPSREPPNRPQSALGDSMSSPETQPQRMTRPGYDIVQEADKLRSRYAAAAMRTGANTSSEDRMRDNVYGGLADGPAVYPTRTPPRSPVSPLGPRPEKSQFDGSSSTTDTPVAPTPNQSNGDEETLKGSEHAWIARLLDGHAPESTTSTITPPLVLKSNTLPQFTSSLKESTNTFDTDNSTMLSRASMSSVTDDGSDSGDDEGTGLWARPPLTVQTANFPPPPPPPPPVAPRMSDSSIRGARRVSVFVADDQDTWAVRPPPEDVYERLEEFFPGHDLDKPVIDANSGGSSPTTAEHSIPLPPEPAEKRWKHKKSIRVVAAEHKKKIDRTSRMDTCVSNNVRRHRSTKLWDSKTEEMTAEKLRSSIPESPSPSVGPKPIFKWVRGELIGKGTYGRVYLALNATTGEMIAVKQVEIPRTASDMNDTRQVSLVQALKQESETLKDLDHPNIVQYLGFEETPTHLSIFLEYVPGGSIGSCLKKHGKFDEDVTKSFTGQILSGLEYLHSKGILHRDLKADNILVEASGVCKISDFGISKRTDDVNANGQFTAMQGSVFWMAPEVINSKENGYNSKIDIWSVGCVVLEMWAGERPWSSEEMIAVMFKLYGRAAPPIPRNVHLSPLADDFRKNCFAINPDERPTATELRRHKYLILPPDWVFNGFK